MIKQVSVILNLYATREVLNKWSTSCTYSSFQLTKNNRTNVSPFPRNSFLKTMTCNPCCILFLHFRGGLGPSPTLELEHYVKTFFYTADPLLVIIEYVPYGDLLGYLRKSGGINDMYFNDPDIKPQTSLTSKQLMKFAWQIADGMSYLSSRSVSAFIAFTFYLL